MPADQTAVRPLAIVLHAGTFERVHYALVMASAAAAIDVPAIVFVTGPALRAFAEAPVGWRTLDSEEGRAGGAARDDAFGRAGVARFEELVSAAVELGVRFIACEMGLRAENMTAAELRADIPFEHAGFVTLLNAAGPGGRIVFV
jgi:peroxiredoxin family protein